MVQGNAYTQQFPEHLRLPDVGERRGVCANPKRAPADAAANFVEHYAATREWEERLDCANVTSRTGNWLLGCEII